MSDVLKIILSSLIALAATSWVRPYIIRVAKVKRIVDNPDARKLHRIPVPVLGGLTVGFGVMAGMMTYFLIGGHTDYFPVLAVLVIMFVIGFVDDTITLSPRCRLFVEILLLLYLIFATGNKIGDFHGLWGIGQIPNYVSIPVTLFSCAGIINAINLIDGVDGYSSGYSIVGCILFGIMFYHLDVMPLVILAAVTASALIPFFLYNVFGKHSKMFLGDAGTLSLGIIFSIFVMTLLSPGVSERLTMDMGTVPFALAVLCIPVFDTLRVMFMRMIRGESPYNPDKTHLHHLFIELGFSHIGTAVSIISMNLFVVLCWFSAYKVGLSTNMQLFVVVVLGVVMTFGFWLFVKRQIRNNTAIYRVINKIGSRTCMADTKAWRVLQARFDKISNI